jgi:DNA-binding beta-propeller fold protein YncE
VKTKYYSICLKDDIQFAIGTYDYPRPVRIVSLTEEEHDFSVNFPNKTYPKGNSFSTYIMNSDKVVITDRYEHTVYIYDIKTNTRVEVKDDQIQEPCRAAVGPSDSILVCSRKTNTIVQISQTGQIVTSYKIDIKHPYRVCVSHNKSFFVVTNNCVGNRKMQKFKIST